MDDPVELLVPLVEDAAALEELEEVGRMSLREAREKTDRELVLLILTENNFNLTQSAADLGISRPTLYELMEKLGINK